MLIQGKQYRSVWREKDAVYFVDQTKLPFEFSIFKSSNYKETIGGYSVYDLTGGYVTRKKGENSIIKEHFVRVVSFATEEAFKNSQKKLFEQIALWAKEWGQESIGYEYEEDLYYIPQ